jgi:TolB-like protein
VNLGDVIEEGDRIYGDGVNIAARLEGLAEAGGICISGSAHEQIKNKLALGYEYIGEHTVKNISEPLKVYRVPVGPKAATPKEGKEKGTKLKNWKWIALGATGAIIVIIGILVIWNFYLRGPSIEPASVETEQAPEVSDVKEGPKTIAVLPFENLSPEKDQEYFADGITEELLNSLARISELEVRGRTSSFSFKGSKKDLPTISELLNVEYILEGSVRKSGEQVRITVQLINTRKDAHLWSKTYERNMDDIFAIQDDIAQSVAGALQITLGVGELSRTPGMTSNIDAYDAYLAGCSLKLQAGRENISQAVEQLEQAVALDPKFAIAWYILGDTYGDAIPWIPERGEEFVEKREATRSRIVELIPETDLALRMSAITNGDRVEEERLLKKALSLAPANYNTNYNYAWFLNFVGRPTDAIDYFQRCVRMEPLASRDHLYFGFSYELSGNSDAATIEIKKARELTNHPADINSNLLVLALKEKNRALIDEYIALIVFWFSVKWSSPFSK